MKTLAEALISLSEENNRGFTFIREDGKEEYYSFASFYSESLKRASALKNKGLSKGDRMVIILPDSEDFLFTFFGAVLIGVIPVPIYPPFRPDLTVYRETVEHIVESCQAEVIVTIPIIKRVHRSNKKIIVSKDLVSTDISDDVADTSIILEDTAFIQFTSGSTAYPKGVVVSHKNVAHNVACFMEEGISVTKDDIGVSWLPLFHDMGLIGCVFGPLYYNVPMYIMPPLMFIKKPIEWLRLITRYKATISIAPNFAYGFCTARVKDLSGLDLSSWRVAGCGSEPISYETIKEFIKKFAPVGFKEEFFMASYGMAESTLAVSFSKLGKGLIVDEISSSSFSEQVMAEFKLTGGSKIIGCGKPFKNHDIAIMDDKGNILKEREIGEIVVKGPSVTSGYYNNEEATNEIIRDGWLHSGDLGYFVDENLYVCGRKKDLIIIAGKNYYPQDIEWSTNNVDGVRRGNVVAFGFKKDLTEQTVVIAESRVWKKKSKEIRDGIKKAVYNKVGIRVDIIEVVPPGTIPKTSSGKLQRSKTKQWYESGTLVKKKSLFSKLIK